MIGVLEGLLSGVCLACRHDKAYARAFFSFGKKAFQIKIFMLCQLGISIFMLSSSDLKASTADKFRQEKLCNLMSKCHNTNIVLQLAVPHGLVNLSHVFTRCPWIKRNFLRFENIWQHRLGPQFRFILKSASKICWFNLAYSTRLIWTILAVAFCEWKWPYEIKLRPY